MGESLGDAGREKSGRGFTLIPSFIYREIGKMKTIIRQEYVLGREIRYIEEDGKGYLMEKIDLEWVRI